MCFFGASPRFVTAVSTSSSQAARPAFTVLTMRTCSSSYVNWHPVSPRCSIFQSNLSYLT